MNKLFNFAVSQTSILIRETVENVTSFLNTDGNFTAITAVKGSVSTVLGPEGIPSRVCHQICLWRAVINYRVLYDHIANKIYSIHLINYSYSHFIVI